MQEYFRKKFAVKQHIFIASIIWFFMINEMGFTVVMFMFIKGHRMITFWITSSKWISHSCIYVAET